MHKKSADIMMLESVTRFMFDSIGSQLSTKRIADAMTTVIGFVQHGHLLAMDNVYIQIML